MDALNTFCCLGKSTQSSSSLTNDSLNVAIGPSPTPSTSSIHLYAMSSHTGTSVSGPGVVESPSAMNPSIDVSESLVAIKDDSSKYVF